jgi:hypothetical protein
MIETIDITAVQDSVIKYALGQISNDRPKTVPWCQSCRLTRMQVHCSDPVNCGGMKNIPYHEAKKAYDEIHCV